MTSDSILMTETRMYALTTYIYFPLPYEMEKETHKVRRIIKSIKKFEQLTVTRKWIAKISDGNQAYLFYNWIALKELELQYGRIGSNDSIDRKIADFVYRKKMAN